MTMMMMRRVLFAAQSESGKLDARGSEETGRVCMSEHSEMSGAPTTRPIARSSAAARMRLHRQRRKEALRCFDRVTRNRSRTR